MKKLVLAAAGFCLCFMACNSSGNEGSTSDDSTLGITTNEESVANDTAWVSLFDGQTLQGWHTYGQSSTGSSWSVDSGAIHLDAADKNSNKKDRGDLVTNQEFGDFDLELDWKISKNGNSGIIFYVQEDTTKYKETYNTGIEMQVLDNAGHPDAKIIKHRAGDIYDLITSSPEMVKPAGEWNHVEIRSQNGKLNCSLNGTNVISTELWTDEWKKLVANSKFKSMPGFGTFKTGHIALQDHGNEVWFKNIRIKRL